MRLDPQPGLYLSLYCEDDGPFAPGFRRAVVVSAGWRYIRLLEPATLRTAKVTRPAFAKLAPRPIDVPPAKLPALARRIRRRRTLLRRCDGAPVPEATVKRALDVLGKQRETQA